VTETRRVAREMNDAADRAIDDQVASLPAETQIKLPTPQRD
jgi:hypothetical protein